MTLHLVATGTKWCTYENCQIRVINNEAYKFKKEVQSFLTPVNVVETTVNMLLLFQTVSLQSTVLLFRPQLMTN